MIQTMNAAQLINATSGDVEYYTDPAIIRAARGTMGSIHLDPASCAQANQTVMAGRYFTIETDGLSQEWHGNIWLNWPFGREANPVWCKKALYEFMSGHCLQACIITYAVTSEKWLQPLMLYPQCYLSPRTNYWLPDGTKKRGVTKGSVVTYLGPHVDRFYASFRELGTVKVKYEPMDAQSECSEDGYCEAAQRSA